MIESLTFPPDSTAILSPETLTTVLAPFDASSGVKGRQRPTTLIPIDSGCKYNTTYTNFDLLSSVGHRYFEIIKITVNGN